MKCRNQLRPLCIGLTKVDLTFEIRIIVKSTSNSGTK